MPVRKTIVTLVCDLCESENLVETHRVSVDTTAREAEVCESCWVGIIAALALFHQVGHEPPKKETRTGKVLAWPDTPWRFSSHALIRMGERNVKPEEILRVIERPEIKRPGKASDQEIWQRNGTKVVVVPERQVVVTVARASEEPDG